MPNAEIYSNVALTACGGEQPVRFGTAPLKSGRLPNGAVWPIADRQLCDVERVEAPFNGTTDKRE